jgi:hypothetical protein
MATKTIEERLSEIGRRVEKLQARARAASAEGRSRIQPHVDALREQQAAVRAAIRKADDTALQKMDQLDARVDLAAQSLLTNAADDRAKFTSAVEAELDSWDGFFERLQTAAATKTGKAHEQMKAAIAELRERRRSVAELLTRVRTASDEAWRAQKKKLTTARDELEQKADELAAKLR